MPAPQARQQRQRLAERDEIARARRAERDARDQPLEVVHALEQLAQLAALGRAEREVLDRVEPILNPRQRDERPHAATGGAAGRPSPSPCGRSSSSSEPARPPSAPSTTLRCRSVTGSIEQRVGRRRGSEMSRTCVELAALRVAQVGDDRAGGRDGRRRVVEAVAGERRVVELLAERSRGRARARMSRPRRA